MGNKPCGADTGTATKCVLPVADYKKYTTNQATKDTCSTFYPDYTTLQANQASETSCGALSGYKLLSDTDYATLQANQASAETCVAFQPPKPMFKYRTLPEAKYECSTESGAACGPIMSTAADAEKACDANPKCIGYVSNGSAFTPVQQLTGGSQKFTLRQNYDSTGNYEFRQQPGTTWWDAAGSGDFTCPGAAGRNTSGNGGDYGNYCIFNNSGDAESWCASDDRCSGYVTNGSVYQAINDKLNPHSTANGRLYLKVVR